MKECRLHGEVGAGLGKKAQESDGRRVSVGGALSMRRGESKWDPHEGQEGRGKGGQERTRGSEGEWREGSGRGGVLVSGTGWGMLCQGSGLTAARLTSCRDTITHS